MTYILKLISKFTLILILLLAAVIQSEPLVFPDPVIIEQSDADISEKQDFPTLTFDNSGFKLHYLIENTTQDNIKSLALNAEPQFTSTNAYYLLDSSSRPYYPVYQSIDNKNILYWYEKLYDADNNDTLYQQQVLTFNNEVPEAADFLNQTAFNYNRDSFDYPAQFARAENRLYCEVLKQKLSTTSNNTWELSLRSVDWNTLTLYPTNLHFSANGKTVLTGYADSLLLIKSWVICTSYDNFSCDEWAAGYKAYIIHNNKIKNIYALHSFDVNDANDKPTDIEKAYLYGNEIYALKQSKQLVRIDYERMQFELIVDLSQYVPDECSRFIPIQTNNSNVLVVQKSDFSQSVLIRFDQDWAFIDSTLLPFEGEVQEISDYVYTPQKDMLAYAYSTSLFENDPTKRIMLQAVLFDEEIFLNPPDELPNDFIVTQNYPNPFNPNTTIEYSIPSSGQVAVDVFNIRGQKVVTLTDTPKEAGNHFVEWDASQNSSGIYLIKVSYNDQTKSIKSLLLK